MISACAGAAQKASISTTRRRREKSVCMGNSHATTPAGGRVQNHYSLARVWHGVARRGNARASGQLKLGGGLFGLDEGVENTDAQLADVAAARREGLIDVERQFRHVAAAELRGGQSEASPASAPSNRPETS